MKVTIVEYSRHDETRGNFWSSTGGCFLQHACRICPLYPYIAGEHCATLRDRFITAVAPTIFPQTFDTDDYPELLL